MATPYPKLGWGMGQLPMNTGSDMTASFLRKIHIFCHLFMDLSMSSQGKDQCHAQN
jgi:hypothetical protein